MTRNQIENKSEEVLKSFDLLKTPVNVERLAKKLNISIEHKDLDDSVSGFLVKKEGKTIIGLNIYHHEVRKRFTISHEIGHYFLHTQTPLFVDYYKGPMLYRSNQIPQNYRMEKEANAFAAALLMPKKLIAIELSKLAEGLDYENKLFKLSDTFKVSTQAMDYRLKSLGHYDYGF